MFKRRFDQAGDTLLEVIFAIVILGLVSSALFAAFATASTASGQTRNLATVDAVLRNAAEATKQAVRVGCYNGGATYSVTYTAPVGFTPPANVSNVTCPPRAGAPATQAVQVNLTASAPNGAAKTLRILVRSP